MVINAFLAAEDKNFYEHGGIDFTGMARAAVSMPELRLQPPPAGRLHHHPAGRQELPFDQRGVVHPQDQGSLLAMRIERTYSKDKILELYLNEIYLGLGAYGVAAASLVYFDKSVNELTIAKPLSRPRCRRRRRRCIRCATATAPIERRNYVVDRLLENGWIKQADADKARKEADDVTSRSNAAHISPANISPRKCAATCSSATARRSSMKAACRSAPRSIPKLQVMARKTMVRPREFRRGDGYRGDQQARHFRRWGVKARRRQIAVGHLAWRMAWCWRPATVGAHRLPAAARTAGRQQGTQTGIDARGVRWAKPASGQRRSRRRLAAVLRRATCLCDPLFGKDGNGRGPVRLRQLPEVSGAMVGDGSLDRRVLRWSAAFSFDQSQFNRATQAYRQPGSSFKPLVYSTALDNGYTPSTVVVDAPIEIDQGQGAGVWRPENYSTGKYYGPVTLRVALQRSLNTGDRAAGAGHRHALDRRIRQAVRRL
jgi:penicillin-binding protein 1A